MAIPASFTIESNMSAMPDTSFFTDSLNWLSIGTEGSIAVIILAFISCLLITRNTKQVRVLLFPMLISWNAVGLYPGMPALFISGIVFVHATLSTDVLAGLLTGTIDTFKSINKRVTEPFKEKKTLQKNIASKITTKQRLTEAFPPITPEQRAEENRRYQKRYWELMRQDIAESKKKENQSTGAPPYTTDDEELLRRLRQNQNL